MPESKKPVWLGQMDTYEDFKVPDEDFATALKVIRTVRNVCLGPEIFDADGAVILSHAHKKLVELALQFEQADEHAAQAAAAAVPAPITVPEVG